MEKNEISALLNAQREFFDSGKMLDISFRKNSLDKLYSCIKKYEGEIAHAIKLDLGKSLDESFMCEIGLTLSEISYMKKHINKLSKPKRVATPLSQFSSRSYVLTLPYGNVLIMSPWNYPFLLTLEPLVDAIAAGNTALVKPSAYSKNTGIIIKKIIEECFDENYVAVILGGREENSALLNEKFDLIFFTGSKNVGREVLMHASKHLTPSVLELGGKSPCIITNDANIKLAAHRVVFGKYLNCGQTCVAPDYILCHKDVKEEFISCVKSEIEKQYNNALESDTYGKIINEKHFSRLLSLIDKEKVVYGGDYDKNKLKIAPTVMDNVTFDDKVMGEEIFGPIMPIIEYEELSDVIDIINSNEKPLALYIFTSDKKTADEVLSRVRFGGGCVNDVVIHLATSNMGFGGVGESGMGAYHGEVGFNAFSHKKSIVDKATFIDLPMRYSPYNGKLNKKLVRMFLK